MKPDRDPYTGSETTGHEWNGIKELQTPIPRIVWFFLILSTLTAILLWILYPTWPYGKDYTRGVLGVDQRNEIQETLSKATDARLAQDQRILSTSFENALNDPKTLSLVQQHGGRLFEDNCAACHGSDAGGGNGYPSLTDDAWLWGGEPEVIMETLRVGINSVSEEARYSEMMGFGKNEILDQAQILAVIGYIQSLSHSDKKETVFDDSLEEGRAIFEEQCSSCHGDDGYGSTDIGAPNLTDDFWIYGGDTKAMYDTIYSGRQGVMPHWSERLSEADRKTLTLYILDLEQTPQSPKKPAGH